MATRWDPKSTSYTSRMLGGGAFTDDQIKQMQQAGITMGDLQGIGLLGPPEQAMTGGSQNYVPGGGAGTQNEQLGLTAYGKGQQQNAAMLRLMLGLSGQQQPQQQPPTWNQVGQAAGLSPADISQFQAMNRTPADIARQFNVLGPQSAGLSPQQFQFQVPQQVVPRPVTGQTVVPAAQLGAQPVKQYQGGGMVTGNNWDWTQVAQAVGLSQADVSQFQQQGLTAAQVAQRFGQPAQPVSQGRPATQGGGTGLAGAAVQQPKGPTDAQLFGDPLNQMNFLGAAALGSPMVVNPPPSGQPSSKSGVADVGKPVVSQTAPQTGWNWDTLANAAGGADSLIPYMKAGFTPTEAGRQLGFGTGATPGLAGPWLNAPTGSVFSVNQAQQPMSWGKLAQTGGFTPNDFAIFQQQGLTPAQVAQKFNIPLGGPTQTTPLSAAAQPTATAYSATPAPFAQAPAAPGLQIPQIPQTPLVAAHTSALANAGQALYSHFGGDPASASAADIANFHHQLLNATGSLAAAPQPTAVKKMQSGGRVPGQGNEDTVPALLTPGEYVIPKPKVQQLMRTGKLPIKMADGGTVPDDQSAPPEARRKTLTTATQSSSSSSAPAAPAAPTAPTVPAGSHLVNGLASAAQTYANSVGGGGIPAGSTAGAGAYGTVGSFMAGQGSAGAAGSLGKLPAGGGMQSALGGIGSGLSQAAQAIASSVKPWQVQPYQQPYGSGVAQAPQVQMQAPPAPQQAQQGVNPYAAYAMNQARYPTSPYYS